MHNISVTTLEKYNYIHNLWAKDYFKYHQKLDFYAFTIIMHWKTDLKTKELFNLIDDFYDEVRGWLREPDLN